MGRKLVTESDKETMNDLYLDIKTYAGVARKVGFSPSTVKRYILPNYIKKQNDEKPFNGKILEIDEVEKPKTGKEWNEWLTLSSEEKKECNELRKEI